MAARSAWAVGRVGALAAGMGALFACGAPPREEGAPPGSAASSSSAADAETSSAPRAAANADPGHADPGEAIPGPALASSSAVAPVPVEAPCVREPPLSLEAPAPLSDAALLQALRTGAPIGSASIGAPSRGSLLGAVELVPKGPDGTELFGRAGKYPYGTLRVVRLLERALREVQRCYPGGHRVHVGDLSRETGGPLAPHRSHQSGLDADVGFFYRTQEAWYVAPTADLLDAPRTWALLRALLEGGSVEVIYLDVRVQRLLAPHAQQNPGHVNLDAVFAVDGSKDKLLRHEYGHHTHFHVRFQDPAATALGARVERLDPKGLVRAQGRAVRKKGKR
jgi:hypothetical protein